MPVYQRSTDGSYSEVAPIGWREEHNLFQRFIFFILRTKHCCDEEKR